MIFIGCFMQLKIFNNYYDVVILKKKTTKNTYIRVKDDLKIYITCNYYTKDSYIKKLIEDNQEKIVKMLNAKIKKQEKAKKFSYLGKTYDIVYLNSKDIFFGDEKIFVARNFNLDKWLLKEAERIFQEELDKMYQIFPKKIPYPHLTIRRMTTRWGVCNIKLKRVTLNLELIKKDVKYLDYVIVHELAHFIHPNHSRDFWNLVGVLVPDYKVLRKEMRENE